MLNLEPLRQRFLLRLRDRAAVLRGHLIVLSCVGDDRDTIDAAMLLFHSIAGAAGTYDLAEVAALARRAESLLTHAIEEGTVAPEVLSELDSIVAVLAIIRSDSCKERVCQ